MVVSRPAFKFPFNIDVCKHYIVIPLNDRDFYSESPNFYSIESAEQLINNTNSKTVDSSIFEHMDICLLKNGSYNVDQHSSYLLPLPLITKQDIQDMKTHHSLLLKK